MDRLSGKVAVITGAASGMGLAAAELFAREGARVVATDVVADVLEAQVGRLEGDLTAVPLDVVRAEQWAHVVDTAVRTYGGVDVLVNNAGVFLAKGVLETEREDWDRVLSINAMGVWLGMKAVIPQMQRRGGGSIVNCSSIAGLIGGEADGHGAAYSASKGAVRSMTKHAAQWFAGDGIRVNSVHPGAVFTGMARAAGIESREAMAAFDQGRTPLPPHVGEPMDIAYGYLYLASDESAFVTGAELVIDGGWTTH
ncbi:SDR family NAD(P)-dependent oxidoreductase [Cellulomonas sp. C5510]|uniref:SDR family NAD(P)-dependent oxidoreductase n=1 Tax=Cellulomonas sp. C5510 TaxID=2871170 RepID=UPI001C947DFD|nr:glucose 1-dehydrogenase [Cellulomonas sp. C5510]QZN86970.1 glucose 1-dehydrogenase [Cellulomonas sp. C5510]